MGLVDDLRAGPGNDLDHARDLMAQSADEIDKLRAENTNCSNEINRLNAELDRTNREITRLTTEQDQARDEITKLNTDRVLVSNEVTRLNTDLVVARDELARLNAELVQATNDVRRLRNTEDKVPAAARKDLIRRLVAVAISVGFASQIVFLHVIDRWTSGGLDQGLGAELARLTTALLVILLGWDWYDRDVEDKPLRRIARFILDAVIVFTELLLLLSSKDASLWSSLLVIVFGFYVVWDILAIIDHPSAFGFPDRPTWRRAPTDILCTYIGGLSTYIGEGDKKKRGPPINVGWFIYFIVLLLVLPFPGRYADFAICLMVALGACVLWSEGVCRRDGRRLIAWWGRLLAWAALAILYNLIGYPWLAKFARQLAAIVGVGH